MTINYTNSTLNEINLVSFDTETIKIDEKENVTF